MSDFTPVGNTGKQSDPFGAINNILGIAGKQQELRSQGLMLQQTQMETQAMREANDFMGQYNPEDHMDPTNGTSSLQMLTQDPKFSRMSGMGQTKVYNHMMQVKQNQLTNLKSLQDMDQSALSYTQQQAGGLRDSPNLLKAKDNHDAAEAARAEIRDRAAHLKSMGPQYVNGAGWLEKIAANPDNLLESGVRSFNMGAAAVAQQQPVGGADLAGRPTVTRPSTGEVSPAPIAGGYKPPTPSEVAATTEGKVSGVKTDRALSDSVIENSRNAPANIRLWDNIDRLADAIAPGAAPDVVSRALAATGLTKASEMREELDKELGAINANYAKTSGSDTRMATAMSQMPTSRTQTSVIHQAADRGRGLERQNLVLSKLQQKHDAATNHEMNGFSAVYSHAVTAADPLTHEYLAQKTPEAKNALLQRWFRVPGNKAESIRKAQEFEDKANAVKAHSPNLIGAE